MPRGLAQRSVNMLHAGQKLMQAVLNTRTCLPMCIHRRLRTQCVFFRRQVALQAVDKAQRLLLLPPSG
jgi:hypothetical protein